MFGQQVVVCIVAVTRHIGKSLLDYAVLKTMEANNAKSAAWLQ
jgi:hypothetical protein